MPLEGRRPGVVRLQEFGLHALSGTAVWKACTARASTAKPRSLEMVHGEMARNGNGGGIVVVLQSHMVH